MDSDISYGVVDDGFHLVNKLKPLTPEQIRQILTDLTYKPGWKWLVAYSEGVGCYMLQITAPIIETYSGEPDGTFYGSESLPMYFYSREQVEEWFRHAILRCEEHEMDEWIKRDGDPEPIFNPHNVERSWEFRMNKKFKAAEKHLADKVESRMK